MTDRTDHLIERAAALLRGGSPPPPDLNPAPPRPAPEPPRNLIEMAGMNGPVPLAPPPRSQPLLTPLPAAPRRPAGVPPLRPASTPTPMRPRPPSPAVEPSPAQGMATEITASPQRPALSLETLERAGLVVARNKRTRISEEYRIVIGRILRALHEEPDQDVAPQTARNVLLVTSAKPGEGKSFTALNLAGSIAQNAGESVLLVDVDPKVRPLTDQLGLGEARGFLDLVSDPALRPEDLVRPTSLPNLAVLPLGTRLGTSPGGAPLKDDGLGLRPIAPALHRLSARFPKSLIMLDAPPCLSTSDPHTLASHVGQVVMVVEAERTQRSEVEAALDLVRVCPTITMLLNKVRLTTSHTFGAYDYFGSYT